MLPVTNTLDVGIINLKIHTHTFEVEDATRAGALDGKDAQERKLIRVETCNERSQLPNIQC